MALIKANTNKVAGQHVRTTLGKRESTINKKEKQYVISSIQREDGSNLVLIFDVYNQREECRVTSKDGIEVIYENMFRTYKKKDVRIVDAGELRGLFIDIENSINEASAKASRIKKLREDFKPRPEIQESVRIKKIKETYKYIDKYKVPYKLKEIKFLKAENKSIFVLYDEVDGVDEGVHKLEYDYTNLFYKYYYMGKFIMGTYELEDIFK